MRRITRLFLTITVADALLLGAALYGGVEPGKYYPAPMPAPAVAWLVGALVGIPAAIGLVLSALLELHDRLPAKQRRWLQTLEQQEYVDAGRFRSVPLRLHASFLLLLLPLFQCSEQTLRHLLACLVIVLIHEAGHALVVRHYGLRVHSIDLSPLGGVCRHEQSASALQAATIAWGGVLAQAVLQLLLFALASLLPQLGVASPWLGVFGAVNISLALFNLLPIPPLDGATAWTLPGLLWRDSRSAQRGSRQRAAPKLQASHLRVVNDALDQAQREAKKRGAASERDQGQR